MNKVAILIFALAISQALGQCDNTYATQLGLFTMSLNGQTAAAVTTLASCTSLQNSAICCTTTEIASFPTYSTTIQTSLTGKIKTRDEGILAARAKIAEAITTITTYRAAVTAAQATLTTWATTPKTGTTTTEVDTAQATIDDLETLFVAIIDNYADIRTAFTADYQASRAVCITELLKDVVGAWCAACAADPQAAGVDQTTTPATLQLGTALETRIRTACFPYLTASEEQSQILRASYYLDALEDMTTALVSIAAETAAGVAAFNTAAVATPGTVRASEIPSGCTANGCTWLTSTAFVDGELIQDEIVLGGTQVDTRRRLQQSGYRRLQAATGDFAPALTEAKFEINYPANPASVVNVNDMSALRVGIFSCIVAFFVALLI